MNRNTEHSKKVYFIRHKMKESKDLRENQLIAWDFCGGCHQRLEDYEQQSRGLTQAHNAFKELENDGGLIVAEFDEPNKFIIATINKGTMRQPYKFALDNGDNYVYTALAYNNPQTYDYCDYPLLDAIKPPYSTVSCAGSPFDKIIRKIYLNEKIKPSVELFHPKQLEGLCEAFLRSEFVENDMKINYCLLRTGKTMPEVDIAYKSCDNALVYAQVTHASGNTAQAKAERLVAFANKKAKTVMFSKDQRLAVDGLDHHFSIEDIFKKFYCNDVYKEMIEDMMGFKALASK